MNKVLIIFSFAFFAEIHVFSQEIIRSCFSSFGNSALGNGILYRQTVGQPSNTSVFSNDGTFLRQGFQQPVKSIVSDYSKECTLYLSPNPASDFVTLNFSEEVGKYQVSVFDMNGKLLLREISTSAINYEIDIRKISNGVYLLNVLSESGYHCNQKLIILL